jgi:beta-phosphoglucomutase-like phosphatase (HAD superfamily)
MSGCSQTQRVLDILQLNDAFAFIATRDDVERGKLDPEIYLLVIRELHLDPNQVVAIEDSPSGVEAALSAGLLVVSVATPFTRSSLFSSGLFSKEHLAEHPQELETILAHAASSENQLPFWC